MKEDFYARVSRSYESVADRFVSPPKVGVILGSGLSGIADSVEGIEIPYQEIDGFPAPTVAGHRGIMKAGDGVVVMAGRFHFYEGHTMDTVVLPAALLSLLGVETLIITNAAGAVNTGYSPGDLVLIRDQINLMGTNPLIGAHIEEFGPRFPDMSTAYPAALRDAAREIAGDSIAEGVYAGLTGPSYETPAEIRMLRAIGADLVGMSTVPEVIVAAAAGIKVLGISCVTNMAAGILDRPLDHREVMEAGKRVEGRLSDLVMGCISSPEIRGS